MNQTNLAGAALMAVCTSLAGALVGWELGPWKLEISRDQLTLMGAVCGSALSLLWCIMAMERSQARARNEVMLTRFNRTFADRLEPRSSSDAKTLLDGPHKTMSARLASVVRPLTRWTGRGTCR